MTPEQRQLVKDHARLPQMMAQRLKHTLPSAVDRSDLVSAGNVGLCQAAMKWDETKGDKFKPFASYRVRGAMIDYLRKLDHLPRALRTRANQTGEQVTEILSMHTEVKVGGREPVPYSDLIATDDEPCEDVVARRDYVEKLISQLSVREQFVVTMYYNYHCDLTQIGEMLGISQSRACQLHTAALRCLREIAIDIAA
jgi:RNA polymerase sigma factor for flagellar operon FliA